ncbi:MULTISPECIES: phosphatidylserine decarboxylase family protein [Sphingobacterium]|uniref:Phosphatidylserine decarboxylase proenzyme n=1 Tax=Sphingobacterium ginsenosidimutans TaxID=687845 RepID=A0ABP8AJ23_9SPHI|nr:phosphatidylserine decarboxylase family protein [Sphingobacterium sp. E70]ULT28567.1 phosphatidylserine decarboxylase family protein [Sphingobacterium sp. E70]
MKFHKEGYTTLAIAVLFIFIINAVADYYDAPQFVKWFIYALSAFLFITVVQFFRSPKKVVIPQDGTILCPADGKVVVIEETEENEYFHDRRIQVSIFMSPINVHVNRNPISGLVTFFKYHPGKFLVAWHPKSSTDNERTTVVVKDKTGREVLFRQIAGALARRIVWYVKENDQVVQGNEFGFIKFGSRVDLFLPLGTEINVNIGDKVTGAKTVIGKF